jgi:two-component system LytT family response regulator
MIRTLIADDEPLARERLRQLVEAERDFELVAECSGGEEAVASIAKERPDVVLLDVRMPGMNGFEVAAQTEGPAPAYVFVTAYEQYALRAFEHSAVDYLLKPVTRDRFRLAAERVRYALTRRPEPGVETAPAKVRRRYLDRVLVRYSGRRVVVPVDDIEWINGAGNYRGLHCAKGTYLLRCTMNVLERRLDPEKFIRIHRCTMVRIDRIAELQTRDWGDYAVVLKGGQRLALSRSHRHKIRQLAGDLS